METGDKKFDCYKCKHRGSIPGDTHSCCNYPGLKAGPEDFFEPKNMEIARELNLKANTYGIMSSCMNLFYHKSSGWFMWPVNFDPVWLRNCDGFEQK